MQCSALNKLICQELEEFSCLVGFFFLLLVFSSRKKVVFTEYTMCAQQAI